MKGREEKNLTYALVTQYLVSLEVAGLVDGADCAAVLPALPSGLLCYIVSFILRSLDFVSGKFLDNLALNVIGLVLSDISTFCLTDTF